MEFLRNVPIGQYVSGKSGWLRRMDPRLKFAWVLMFLVSPVLACIAWRIGLVLALLMVTFLGALPVRIVWRPLVFLTILSCVFGLLAIFLPASEVASELTVRSPHEVSNVLTSGSSWELIKINPINLGSLNLGQLVIDRRSAELGIKTSTLIFTVVHSVNLMLITTSPEELMWTLRWFLSPLLFVGLPLDRLSFQLLLALRFIPLIQEEFQNLVRSIVIRSIDFKKLKFKKSLGILLTVGERLLINILRRAEQGADALILRNGGFLLSPKLFRPKRLIQSRTIFLNTFLTVGLIFTLFLRRKYGAI